MSPELMFLGGILSILGGLFAVENRIRRLITDLLEPLSVEIESQGKRIEKVEAKASGTHDAVTRLQAQCETRH